MKDEITAYFDAERSTYHIGFPNLDEFPSFEYNRVPNDGYDIIADRAWMMSFYKKFFNCKRIPRKLKKKLFPI